MSKKNHRRVNLKKSNLNPNGTTIDGGFPRHNGWVNPYDWWKVAINKVIEILAICFPLGWVFRLLLGIGILEPIVNVLNGTAPFKSHVVFNLVIVGIFAIVLVIYPLVTIGDVIWYIKSGERSFLLSRPIRRIWNKNLGQYDYKQHEYEDRTSIENAQHAQAKAHFSELYGICDSKITYTRNWKHNKHIDEEEEVSSRMLVLLIIEIIVYLWLKESGIV